MNGAAPNPSRRGGTSAWFDLPVVDLADAMSFYTGLLNWDYAQMDESPLSSYVMIRAQGQFIGGLRAVKKPLQQPAVDGPVLYFTVDNLKASVARAQELGAEIVGDTVRLGRERGAYQWIRDREKNLIGLWSLS